jgi:hypothetical protein
MYPLALAMQQKLHDAATKRASDQSGELNQTAGEAASAKSLALPANLQRL